MPLEVAAIHESVAFDIALKNLKGNHFSLARISFKGVSLAAQSDRLPAIAAALATNTTCTDLDLSDTCLTDAGVQQLAVSLASGCAPQLRVIDLRGNPFTLVGETVLQGLGRLRPTLTFTVSDEPTESVDGFVHDKTLVEGLTAWSAESLAQGQQLRCPQEIVGGDKVVLLQKGFQGANGTKYTCEFAEFELGHGTGNLVLVRLEPEAKLRLCARTTGDGDGCLV